MEATSTTTELQDAAERAAQGIRDPEAMRKSRERMDLVREALRKKVGVINVVSDLVRETRDDFAADSKMRKMSV